MRTDDPGRRFSREVKLAAVQRMAAGASVSKLARELGISRKGLYQWQKQFRVGGASALREGGRPQRGAAASHEQPEAGALQSSASDELLRALARIAELERLVGQQAADIDFFQRALQHVETARQRSGKPGGTASTRSSKR
ncbi:transposase [Rhizobium azibense]|uniref:Transposase-like protein n=1 Tax=Rhizobium azibense TaxID=1136135 RepID=A0A4V2VAW3_9HYPH|nr:transposase-like protein [Rhizobium azibense]